MNSLIFEWMSVLHKNGWNPGYLNAGLFMLGILACFLVGFYFYLKNGRQELNQNQNVTVVVAVILVFGTSFYFNNRAYHLKGESSSYKVGMCFKRIPSKDTSFERSMIKSYEADRVEQEKSVAIAKSLKAENVKSLEADLKSTLKSLSDYKLEYDRINSMPKELHYVIVSQSEKSHLAYLQEYRTVATRFQMDLNTYQIECSDELKQVVQVYQATGKLVAVNK